MVSKSLRMIAVLCIAGMLGKCSATYFYEEPLSYPPLLDRYEFWLTVEDDATMTFNKMAPTKYKAAVKGLLQYNIEDYRFMEKLCNGTRVGFDSSLGFLSGDGRYRQFVSVNGSLPGPTLVVAEYSMVVVHVHNGLTATGITMHWHGLHQQDNNWNDGVGYVTQFPIAPSETFTYRFKVEGPGTYWYHEHASALRGEGVYGALIVVPVHQQKFELATHYIMDISDWSVESAASQYDSEKWKINRFSITSANQCRNNGLASDGTRLSEWQFDSALINGHGWFNISDLLYRPHELPLTAFSVTSGTRYYFHVINAGSNYPFLVSIDDHELTIVATDGFPIKKVQATHFIIYPGERYDFTIVAKTNPHRSEYLIIVRTLAILSDNGTTLDQPQLTLGTLKYDSKSSQGATGSTQVPLHPFSRCSSNNPCTVVNCPFRYFHGYPEVTCLDAYNLESASSSWLKYTDFRLERRFINTFADPLFSGRQYVRPRAPPGLFWNLDQAGVINCPLACSSPPCYCTNHIDFSLGAIGEIVLFSKQASAPNGLMDVFSHPIHIHGMHFQVIKIGYPSYDPNTGFISRYNQDIHCGSGDPLCNNVSTWQNKNMDNELRQSIYHPVKNFVMKDTVVVPSGGYVVVRFISKNPGWWASHCHMLPHHLLGMFFLLRVGTPMDIAPPPEDFPITIKYRNLKTPFGQSNVISNLKAINHQPGVTITSQRSTIIWVIGSCLVGVCFGLVVASFLGLSRRSSRRIPNVVDSDDEEQELLYSRYT